MMHHLNARVEPGSRARTVYCDYCGDEDPTGDCTGRFLTDTPLVKNQEKLAFVSGAFKR
jgi:hypothetical protein